MAAFLPKVLSPALPSELISYILDQHKYPTTLVVCIPRAEFISSFLDEATGETRVDTLPSSQEQPDDNIPQGPAEKQEAEDHSQNSRPEEAAQPTPTADAATTERARTILSTPLRQTAVARHIRTVFVPTVSHLRAFLSVFSAEADPSSKARPPPAPEGPSAAPPTPLLLIYGLLELHRDTSEWNAQGLGSTAACLVEAAHRSGMEAVVVEPAVRAIREVQTQDDEEGQEERNAPDGDRVFVRVDLEGLLSEEMPVLNMAARRLGRDGEGQGWSGRTVPVRMVLGRWFCF
ncbi:hypothetical protein GGTG_08763 [Gaeumannomyces tritici R3-111a-1]|uniref:Uncharacterized protein n=1 Tax=Gaeumannomyces tritici (strain R3-111a-1) TaxID=644352 RepID=J3P5H4_GAET3|nr:hypothetical protein GGTG_08763 [Gaeumannomyces tritici R3-111a-1]EJT74925.1 hypothetical protein GGTG_08763 [Gaeumannomyces tritici R3-111a-1]